MKKTLIALAVGSAFVAPAAFADVTISGAINMGIVYLNVGDGEDGSDGVGNFGIASNYTNITISSMEDLGGGLKLDFAAQIDWGTAGVGGLNNRNSHIGLVSDSWGGVWYGSNENLYERYFYTIDPLDGAAGIGGNLQMLGNPGNAQVFSTCGGVSSGTGNSCGASWYRRDQSSIWYDSPNWNGFTFGVVLQTNYAKTADINPNMWQIGAKYVGTTMPLEAWGVYGRRKDQFGLSNLGVATAGDSSKDSAWHIGAAYTLGDIKIFAGYEDLKYEQDGVAATDVSEWSRGAWYIGGKWNLASGYIGAQFIQALEADAEIGGTGGTDSVDDTGAFMIGLGYYHNMSKQTQAYVMGTYIDNGDAINYATAGFQNAASTNIGATHWGLTVGLKHSF